MPDADANFGVFLDLDFRNFGFLDFFFLDFWGCFWFFFWIFFLGFLDFFLMTSRENDPFLVLDPVVLLSRHEQPKRGLFSHKIQEFG